MTAYTLFGQPTGGVPGGVAVDNADYTLGVQFTTSQAGTLTAIWFFSAPGAVNLPDKIALYQVTPPGNTTTGTLVHSEIPTWSGAIGSGWVRAAFASPPSLSPFTSYKACVFNDQGSVWYSNTSGYWTTGGPGANGITSGPLTAPNTAGADGGQGSFVNTASLAYPNASFNAANYWVDPELTISVNTVNGAASLTSVPSLASAAVLSRLGVAHLAAAAALVSGASVLKAATVHLAAAPSLMVTGQAAVNVEALWETYMIAAETARAASFSWRMQRSAGGASGQTGFLFQAAYEAQNTADQAYETWRTAFRAANPGARG